MQVKHGYGKRIILPACVGGLVRLSLHKRLTPFPRWSPPPCTSDLSIAARCPGIPSLRKEGVTTPKGLRLKAQGCCTRLPWDAEIALLPNPNGVVALVLPE